jgi:hypothetical protein
VQLKSNGNETTQTEFDAGSHLQLVESVAGENKYDWQDKFEKKSIQKKNQIYKDRVLFPISKENEPMDLSKSEEGSDEDPFAQLESIILGSPKFSAKSNLYYKQC